MLDLAVYSGMKICAAVSGGRDSMALLHYLYNHAHEYGITLSALNCNHRLRGEQSDRDSEFVGKICSEYKIPLLYFEWDNRGESSEGAAREWRLDCYKRALDGGADAVATAHHLDDNAETVLFNLARGSSLAGLTGITDGNRLIRPLVSVPRSEIERYIRENNIPYVDDSTNFTDAYTRNKIRLNVLPELERAVPRAARSIYRFSRLAAEDESYFDREIERLNLIKNTACGVEISFCAEKVIFRRAAVKAIKIFGKKDYTLEQADRLYALQFAENGKKFEFLNLTAYREEGRIAIAENSEICGEVPYGEYSSAEFCGQPLEICEEGVGGGKVLRFDADKIPASATIRFMRGGDRFRKFGGGTKNLGDFFTDRKIPVRLRKQIPLIADGNDVLAVCGVEISDKIKVTENTKSIKYIICTDYSKGGR